MEKTKQKATRKLKGFDFTKSDASVALVGPSVGGPANGIPTLVAKANNYSPEAIKKMQQIQVTMELPAFLEKFFGLYGSDGEILARLMGYVKSEDDDGDDEDWWENYIEEKLSAFTIIKSLHEADNLPEALSKLTETDYLDVLNDQVLVEKALKELTAGSNTPKVDASTKTVEKQVEAPASKVNKKKEKQMTQETEQAKLVEVEKALEDGKVALQKAMEQIAKYEEAEKQAVIKSKTDTLRAVIKDEKQLAVVLKSALALQDEADFVALVDVLKQLNTIQENPELFQEVGASGGAEEKKNESKLAEVIKSKYPQKK